MLLQNVLRDTWQIRTLPERIMEWLLLYVRLDLFERALVTGLVGTALAYAVARFVGRDGGSVASSLPLASAPTRAVATAAPAGTANPTAAQGAPTPAATPAPVAADAFPTPPPARRLARDKDGSLTSAGRPKGTLAPPITRNDDFYVVTKNAVADPVLDAGTWR